MSSLMLTDDVLSLIATFLGSSRFSFALACRRFSIAARKTCPLRLLFKENTICRQFVTVRESGIAITSPNTHIIRLLHTLGNVTAVYRQLELDDTKDQLMRIRSACAVDLTRKLAPVSYDNAEFFTYEQLAPVSAAVWMNANMCISAPPGCGKTTIIRPIAAALFEKTQTNALYICFNKALRDKSAAALPDTVDVKTMHAIAHYLFFSLMRGHDTKKEMDDDTPARSTLNIPVLNLHNIRGRLEALIRKTLDVFCNSDALDIRNAHVDVESMGMELNRINEREIDVRHKLATLMQAEKMRRFVSLELNDEQTAQRDELSRELEEINEYRPKLMRIIDNPAVAICSAWEDQTAQEVPSHSVYLKLVQVALRRREINPTFNYSALIVDEEQDFNPVMCDIVLSMAHGGVRVIMLGDKYQSLYQWRGACGLSTYIDRNAERSRHLNLIHYDLTLSHRFSPEIARYINQVIERPVPIRGNPSITSRLYYYGTPGTPRLPTGTLVMAHSKNDIIGALNLLIRDKYSVNTTDDVKHYLRLVAHACEVVTNTHRSSGVLARRYENARDFQTSADPDALAAFNFVASLPVKSPQRYRAILAVLEGHGKSDLLITTVHRQKGMEFDNVFFYRKPTNHGISKLSENVVYVALTRARKGLWVVM